MDLQLTGKVALVTGASKGIGRSIAQTLASEGMRVTVAARSRDQLATLAAPLGDRCLVQAVDLTEPASPAALVAATIERFGRGPVANALATPINVADPEPSSSAPLLM